MLNPIDFRLAKISLIRGVGCPKELQGLMDNTRLSSAIVVVDNLEAYGTPSYIPPAVIVAGAARRDALLAQGYTRSWALVHREVEIQADDEIGCNELMSKLMELLKIKLYGSSALLTGQEWPMIVEVYPFENYFIYAFKGNKYRQTFQLDPVERKVALAGPAVAVEEKFVNAGASEAKEVMPLVDNGVRYAYAPMRGNTQSSTRGGLKSELMTQLVRDLSNVVKAVNAYLQAIKGDMKDQMTPSFYPVDIADRKVGAVLKAHGVNYFDFCMWLAAHKNYQTRDGKKLGKSKFAWAPGNDPSRWKLPIDKDSRVKNALARINQTDDIPQSKKSGVLQKVRREAKQRGIGVSEKPSSKQKKWIKAYPLSAL